MENVANWNIIKMSNGMGKSWYIILLIIYFNDFNDFEWQFSPSSAVKSPEGNFGPLFLDKAMRGAHIDDGVKEISMGMWGL